MAVKDRLSDPVSILHEKLEAHASMLMSHDFHEFIFIQSGEGTHINNQFSTPFKKGDFLLVKPYEKHAYVIEKPTEVFLVRFTEATRLVLKELVHYSGGKAVALTKAKSPLNFKVSFTEKDEMLVMELLQLLSTLSQEPYKNENLCYYQLLCLISIIERNLSYFPKDKNRPATKQSISHILNHIHKHLKDPEMLNLRFIANKFNVSTNQLGLYFRKETQQSVKQYINQCRLALIGKMVKESEMSFSEIAYQFGYVDESHFYKSFKKFFGVSPTVYRKTDHGRDQHPG